MRLGAPPGDREGWDSWGHTGAFVFPIYFNMNQCPWALLKGRQWDSG